MLSLVDIRDLVGPKAFMRGRDYADSGLVLRSRIEPFTGGMTVSGLVQGGELEPYEVEIDLFLERGRLAPQEGDCSCPVGFDCKHVAALLLHAAKKLGSPEPPAQPAATRPLWEQALRPFLVPPPDAKPPVALQFELVDGGGKGYGLTIRPVLRGAKDRWIRTGIAWGNLTYHQARRAAPAAFRLLDEIGALVTASERSYYHAQPQTVDLVTFPSPRIWSVLDAARDAGLPLVRSGAGEAPVLLDAEPAEVIVDVTGTASHWQLDAYFSADGERLDPRTFTLLGAPGHGIVRWEPGGRDSGPLRLARLRSPLAEGVQYLIMHRGGIEVPETEIEGFLLNGYPVLRRRVTLQSSDGSVELPAPSPPRLAIRAAFGPQRTAEVDWSWRYALGRVVRELPYGGPPELDPDPDRDLEAEGKLVVEACARADALPALLEGDLSSPRLAVRVRLRGDDAIVGLTRVLAALEEVPGVDVERSGDVPRLRAAASAPEIGFGGNVVEGDWFDLQVEVSVDAESVAFAELFTAVAEGQKYLILPSGTYLALDRPEMRRLHEIISEARALAEPGAATARLSRFQVSIWDELRRIATESEHTSAQARKWVAAVHSAAGLASVDEVEVPASLRATLRPYQRAGFAWLAFLYSHRLGGVLADDMGLGKTVQAIALMCHVRESEPAGDPFLVVAPTSVVGNWAAELARFAPHLRVAVITATQARRGEDLAAAVAGADVVLTSYALLRLEYEPYAGLPWAALLLDEAQQVKNHAAKGHRCARGLPAPVKFAITGTPMENNLMELWATYSIVAPGLLGDAKRFAAFYRGPAERGKDPERLALLRRRIAPLMLRRRKEEVAAELPAKIEQVVSLELAPRHRRVYDTLLARERQKVLGLLGDLDRNRIAILRSLTLLRQAALDPSLVDPAHAGVPATKLDALLESLQAVVAEGHRVLVFSQFTRFLGRVRERLDAAGIEYCYLDGRTPDRTAVVARFTSGSADVFLLSLKAGGVGLNLTQADYCILLDPWWNPATEAQAVDRAHRIGQTRTVMVYRLVATDTIEEKVMALKATKGKLIASVLDGGDDGGATALTAEDIRSLLV